MLGIWEYFWTEADWTPPAPSVGQVPAAARYRVRYRVHTVTLRCLLAGLVWLAS